MSTARRSAPVLLAIIAVLVAVLAPTAGAAGTTVRPESGPLSPAFVEALHDPLVTLGLGTLPSPVEVHVSAADETAAARMAEPSSYDLRAEGRLTPVKDQDPYSTCWAFADIGSLESKLMPADPAPDFSEDNLVGRSGYGPSLSWRYNFGGYNFMAVAYFARWAGPVAEADDPYGTLTPPAVGTVQKHVQGVVMIPGRASWSDNALIKRLVRENGALSVGMYWDSSAYSEVTDGTGAIQATHYLKYAWGENHGVDVVGWDDQYPRSYFDGAYGQPPGPGAFLVRNSWGSRLGRRRLLLGLLLGPLVRARPGSRRLRRGRLLLHRRGHRQLRSRLPVRQARRDRPLGLRRPARVGRGPVHRRGDAGRLRGGLLYPVLVDPVPGLGGPDAQDAHPPRPRRPGAPRLRYGEVLGAAAGHQGRRFVVAISLYSPGDYHPLAMERPARSWMRGATATRGQSFMSRNGKTWTDVTSVHANASVCLKAFAQ